MSTKEQVTFGHSLESQVAELRRFATREGYEIIEVFEGKGESAWQGKGQVFADLLKWCAGQPPRSRVKSVIVAHSDRFARNVLRQQEAIERLAKLGIEVIFASQPHLENRTASGKLQTIIAGAISQNFSDSLSERMKRATRSSYEAGRWPHQPPCGYRPSDVPGIPVRDVVQARLMKRGFEGVAVGARKAVVWRELRNEGLECSRTRFYELLRNPFYVSRVVAHDGTLVRGRWISLVDDATFAQVQGRLGGKGRGSDAVLRRSYSRVHPDYPLKGTLRCAACRRPLTGSSVKGKSGRLVRYYECPSRGAARTKDCVRRQALELHAAFSELLERVATVVDGWNWTAELESVWKDEIAALRTAHSTATRALRELLEREGRMVDSWVQASSGLREQLGRRLDSVREEVAQAQARQENASQDLKSTEASFPDVLAFVARQLQGASGVWGTSSVWRKIDVQEILFPEGLLVWQLSFQTPIQAPIFGLLGALDAGRERMASPPGFDALWTVPLDMVVRAV